MRGSAGVEGAVVVAVEDEAMVEVVVVVEALFAGVAAEVVVAMAGLVVER